MLPPSTDDCKLGILHLKRYWQKYQLIKSGQLAPDAYQDEWITDTTLLAALGLGLEQTVKHIYNSQESFESFENWVADVVNPEDVQEKIRAFNLQILQQTQQVNNDKVEKVLTEEELLFWDENGYLIIRNAVPAEDCEKTVDLICDFIQIKKDDPATWYHPHPAKQGIMVQLFQHPLLDKNRRSDKIRKVYEQLWGRKDIWVNADRVGFNPPETDYWKFPGPGMHWDVSLALPIPFGLQGILYLADTAANQGAFTLVPGFQNKIESWLKNLPEHTNPRNTDIHSLGTLPVAAQAGDFIIWHHALPHGSSPNTSSVPRFVQYINYSPADMEVRDKWI
ncbi:MAG TPA: phytanoyl-CoA dioxygenase family protein [Chitinophagaceae bacterium]|nr:phytanoyl-CoA dioxygenase family protein [Chitinophagaceae bacterium]